MNTAPNLQQIARRMIVPRMGANPPPHELASAAVSVVETLINNLSSLVGRFGSQALLRRSLKLSEGAFPCYAEVWDAKHGLVDALGECLRTLEPDVAKEAAAALLAAYLELMATFIGERLTRQLLQAAWPDLFTSPPQEISE